MTIRQFSKNKTYLFIFILMTTTVTACNPASGLFEKKRQEVFATHPLQKASALSEADMAHLPACIRHYLAFTGADKHSKPQNIYLVFDAEMYRKPGDKPMKSSSVQYNFFGDYARLFLMKAGKMGIPFRALHLYADAQASFQVKVAGLFKVVDIKGEALTKAETVTVLNDMCLMAPGSLVDRRLSWETLDSLSARVFFTNGPYRVSADLFFNEEGALVNFISDDRSAVQDDGSMLQLRWSTPVSDYREFDGVRVPAFGKAIWHYPTGEFTYGVFRLKEIRYNVAK